MPDMTTVSAKTPLIFHGHFYQPPRENPRTDIIDIQESAAPFANWNESIWASCYRANAHSRYLDIDHIRSITNNYRYLSFNFGPTLLSWMAEAHPDTLEDIISADKESYKRLGHGNAIAQGFNHTILPLDKKENAEFEIEWGLSSFERWFGRKSEGFWCPETAINTNVIDLLSENGIKFVILSPWQCKSVEKTDGTMEELSGKAAPYDHPYILTGTHGGTIAAFFYHPGLASGISFGHLLQNADNLYGQLLDIRKTDNPALIHTATDGEIYGHHEPYGDMALCALIKKVQERNDFVMSNYGSFLASHPATLHAVLLDGEEHRGTSWSCCHGVSRWYKDCGCHTGGEEGWNQAWRYPLRLSFEHINTAMKAGCGEIVESVFGGKYPIDRFLSSFGTVAAKQETMQSFLDRTAKEHPYDRAKDKTLALVAQCALYSLYSFTSCGWFFSDLGGIEPRQNIIYALQSISLYRKLTGEDLLPGFLTDLQYAKCNRKEDGNGMTIAAQEWLRTPGAVEAVLFFHFHKMLDSSGKVPNYGRFSPITEEEGNIRFFDTISLTSYSATLGSLNDNTKNEKLHLSVKIVEENGNNVIFDGETSASDISKLMADDFSKTISVRLGNGFDEQKCTLLAEEIMLDKQLITSDIKHMDFLEAELLGLSFTALESLLVHHRIENWRPIKSTFLTLITFLASSKRDIDRSRLQEMVNVGMQRACASISQKKIVDDEFLETLTDFIHLVCEAGLDLKMTELQETFYPFLTDGCSSAMKKLGAELNFAAVVEHEQA
jgi:hypothetical protein